MIRAMKSLQRFSLGRPLEASTIFQYQRVTLERCFLSVRLFYALCLFELSQVLQGFQRLSEARGMDPLWLVAWVPALGSHLSAALLLFTAAGLACVLLMAPQMRWARVLFFPCLTLAGGYVNSFGKIDHNFHAAIVIAFFLSFLPAGTATEIRRSFSKTRGYILVVALAIAGFLFCYSVSGFWKVAVGIYQLAMGEVSAFHPQALAYHVTRRLSQSNGSATRIAQFLIEHPWLGWGPYLTTLYGEFFALLAAFRVRSHRVFGLILIGFHMGSALTLGIGFYHHQLLLLVLLVGSPLCPTEAGWRETLYSLPLIGDLALRLQIDKAP